MNSFGDRMELVKADLIMVMEVFDQLDKVASINGVHQVSIQVKNDCGDIITIGYGEAGEPAILDVETELQANAVKITPQIGDWTYRPQPSISPSFPYTINCCSSPTVEGCCGGKVADDNLYKLEDFQRPV